MESKVSIISPVYNGESYIKRYLDSLLNQTYKNLEIIIVNDGSTDSTQEILESYKSKFKRQKIKYKCIYQKNSGQASAINSVLHLATGEFIMWPDSDDTLEKKSTEKKVKFLKENLEYGYVRTEAKVINEETGEFIKYLKCKENPNEYLLEDIIFEKDFWFVPGCFMARTDALFTVIPNKKIFVNKGGQNWQLYLPLASKYKCGYINEPLCNYYVRKNSHSRENVTIEDRIKYYDLHIEILKHTLTRLNLYHKYENKIYDKYKFRILKEAYFSDNKNSVARNIISKYYYKISYEKLTIQEKYYYYTSRITIVWICSAILYKIVNRILRMLKRSD